MKKLKLLLFLLIVVGVSFSCSTTSRYTRVCTNSVAGVLCQQEAYYKVYDIKFIDIGMSDGYLAGVFGPGFELSYFDRGRTYNANFPRYLVTFIADTVNIVEFIYDIDLLDGIKLPRTYLSEPNFHNLVINRHFCFTPLKEVIVKLPQEEINRLIFFGTDFD